jgi:hypothetical protein
MADKLLYWNRALSVSLVGLSLLLPIIVQGQQDESPKPVASEVPDFEFKPVPILTGSTAYFTKVTAGVVQDAPSVSPILLFPMGDKWLVEGKGSYSDTFARGANGSFDGTTSYGLIYAQADYIANRYLTIVGGRFTTPFGMYGERLAPNWIRALQTGPMTSSLISGSSLGGMLRGGFSAGSEKVNFTYSAYFSSNNTNHIVATDRSTGERIGLFLPGPRFEIGASFQQVLQADRAHAVGIHSEWQPNRLPITFRSEFVHQSGTKGTAYWIESVYRLSQIPPLRRLELVGRGEQFFADPKLTAAAAKKLGALGRDTNEGDAGLNYYVTSDVRASASYGRQFVVGRDANLWVIGLTYRFVMGLGPTGNAR